MVISLFAAGKFFELSNHLGNVLAVVSDRKVPVASANPALVARYTPVVVQAQDYSAFGMLMPQRSYNASGYRYGFNGKENDNEVKGEGNQQDYGERIHDTRLGRFLSTDPLTKSYPMLTPFQYASNSPIWMIDLDGLEGVKFSDVWNGRAHILQFITNPDLGGTATETVSTLNRTINPLFLANNYALKLTTGSDYDGNPIDNRGKSGVVADLGVEIMMWLTLAKIGAPKSNQPVEVQLNQQAKALGNTKPKPTQVAAENATSQSTNSTVSKPQIPGRVQSRVNVANGRTRFTPLRKTGEPVSAGFEHVIGQHFNRVNEGSRSIFTITPEELRIILNSKSVVQSPVTAIDGGQYVRTVDTGRIIGKVGESKGGGDTRWLQVLTDQAGNLITSYLVRR